MQVGPESCKCDLLFDWYGAVTDRNHDGNERVYVVSLLDVGAVDSDGNHRTEVGDADAGRVWTDCQTHKL